MLCSEKPLRLVKESEESDPCPSNTLRYFLLISFACSMRQEAHLCSWSTSHIQCTMAILVNYTLLDTSYSTNQNVDCVHKHYKGGNECSVVLSIQQS